MQTGTAEDRGGPVLSQDHLGNEKQQHTERQLTWDCRADTDSITSCFEIPCIHSFTCPVHSPSVASGCSSSLPGLCCARLPG